VQKKNQSFLSLKISPLEKDAREANQMTDSSPCAVLPQQKNPTSLAATWQSVCAFPLMLSA